MVVTTEREEGATGIKWVEARDAARYPTVHRTVPTTKRYPAPNVSSARTQKPRSRSKA